MKDLGLTLKAREIARDAKQMSDVVRYHVAENVGAPVKDRMENLQNMIPGVQERPFCWY